MSALPRGKLTKVVPKQIVTIPGPPGKDGPSKEEIIESLLNNNELLNKLINSRRWVFKVNRDEMGFISSIEANAEIVE